LAFLLIQLGLHLSATVEGEMRRWSRGPDLNRGPVDYESTALPTELPRPRVIHSSIALKKVSNAVMDRGAKEGYCENGYISQPIPTATSKNARNAHKTYLVRSEAPRLERNANVSDTNRAKSNSA
jgi:hypothetical protein